MTIRLDRLPRTIELIKTDEEIQFRYVDQRFLPGALNFVTTDSWQQVMDAIKTLAVRGAPALGVSGVAALALWVASKRNESTINESYINELHEVAFCIARARPTAVNLSWAVDWAMKCVDEELRTGSYTPQMLSDLLYNLTKQLEDQDERSNRAIGNNGARLLKPGSRILTHCNAGSLATVFYGTALGVIYSAAEEGKIERVYADETRPVGQGARLTTWELAQAGIPVTLICDNMAAFVMSRGMVDAVIVGADRIAANGDVANKIGTQGVAILAHEYNIPFYATAPTSTIDRDKASGNDIVIEQRAATEVLTTPIPGVDVLNPAFDVTPARYVTRIITEAGIFSPDELKG